MYDNILKREWQGAAANTAMGYVQVCTAEQAEHGISLDAQESRIRAYCTMRGVDLVAVEVDRRYTARGTGPSPRCEIT